jgi:hypothetical protein
MRIVTYQFPIAANELCELAEMMRRRDILTPGFDVKDDDAYDPMTYLLQKDVHDTNTLLLADRNLMTRWVNLGRSCQITEEHRVAAATLAFCQCCGILIEPNIALYEVAAESGNEAANSEEAVFRVVDNTSPRVWTDIAFGQYESCPASLAENKNPFPRRQVDFCTPLKVWRRNYVLTLKIAALSLKGGQSHRLVEELFDWMYSEYLFLAPATILALCYFSPNSPKKGLLKQLQSSDRERALSGIRNATWDLTLVHQWLKMVGGHAQSKTLNLLGSLDRKLHTVARNILAFTDSDETVEGRLREIFQGLWSNDTSTRLYRKVRAYYRDNENLSRLCNRIDAQPSLDKLITDGEQEIREWHPGNSV